MEAPIAPELGGEFEVIEGISPFFPYQENGAAIATIATGGSSPGHVLLAPKGYAAVATAASLDGYYRFIYEGQ